MKVRIPYVINPEGHWYSGGGKNAEKEPDWGFLMDCADDEVAHSDYQRGWITVDLPLPSSEVEVEGEAVKAGEGK